ncbi:MAG: DUF4176 domain-containing protein [Clostridia bacterium]|nr:DUF4176 domain-containing protein [Clostridia bacterium]
MNDFLPIGSVVKLKELKHFVAICGYYPTYKDERKDYFGVLLPFGKSESNPMLYFYMDDIEEIVFEGYHDKSFNVTKVLLESFQKR